MIERETITLVEVFGALDRGVTVITGNKRLAGATRQAFEQAAIDKGPEVWPTPDILPWTAWLQRVWEEAVVSGAATAPELLLTSQQEQRIWEDIITESMADQPLQQVTGTARRAQEAWQLMQSWRLSRSKKGWAMGETPSSKGNETKLVMDDYFISYSVFLSNF